MNEAHRLLSMLTDAVFAGPLPGRGPVRRPADRPAHPTCYEGEWLCEHSPCPVQSVRLRVRFYHFMRLPQLRCPLCLRTLVFRRWLTAAPGPDAGGP